MGWPFARPIRCCQGSRTLLLQPRLVHLKYLLLFLSLLSTCVLLVTKTEVYEYVLDHQIKVQIPKPSNSTIQSHPSFVASPSSDVYIVSVVVRNTTETSAWDTLTVNAWEALRHSKQHFKCCYYLEDNTTVTENVHNKAYWRKGTRLLSVQYQCRYQRQPNRVKAVSVSIKQKKCIYDARNYVTPVFPKRQARGSLALCAKIVYGHVDPKLVIDWLEYYAELKVDKVLMFTYNISTSLQNILQYYVSKGYLEIKPFDFPWKKDLQRDVGLKSVQAWQDEQVVVLDCQERLRGFSYVGIVDLDEFLLPHGGADMKTMMTDLLKQHPNAAGFTFKSHIFAKNWGPSVNNNGSDIRKYFKRTRPVYTRWKSIYLPTRVQPGTIHTHSFKPLQNYTRIVPTVDQAVVNHYRICWQNFTECNSKEQYEDTSIMTVVNKMAARVSQTHAILNIK